MRLTQCYERRYKIDKDSTININVIIVLVIKKVVSILAIMSRQDDENIYINTILRYTKLYYTILSSEYANLQQHVRLPFY